MTPKTPRNRTTRFVVRCQEWSADYTSRERAEDAAARNNTEPYCPHTDHIVVEQFRGPETHWRWEDIAAQ